MERESIAEGIKTLRIKQGLSLRNVSQESGVSPAMISLIENKKASPTLDVLHKILLALGSNFGKFFSNNKKDSGRFCFAGNDMETIGNKKMRYKIIIPRHKDMKMQMILEEILPGNKPGLEKHEIDVAGYVLEGGPLKLEIIGEGEWLVHKGGSFYVPAGNMHRGINVGKNKMTMITCYCPARY